MLTFSEQWELVTGKSDCGLYLPFLVRDYWYAAVLAVCIVRLAAVAAVAADALAWCSRLLG